MSDSARLRLVWLVVRLDRIAAPLLSADSTHSHSTPLRVKKFRGQFTKNRSPPKGK
jgi:hypothetical protein